MAYSKEVMDRGFIGRIQRYSIKDGPGIRTTVFFKGCSMNCEWCSNPELIEPSPEILSHKQLCLRCGDCHQACQENLIAWKNGGYVIQRSLCNGCGRCVEICSAGARELIGRYISMDQLVSELIKDQVFFDASGGGVTFSGGEPALQIQFLKGVSQKLKKHQIHLALDTCGNVPSGYLEELSDFMDLFLYDLKFMDDQKHQQFTGASNALILANAKRLSALGVRMIIRLVIIPGYNDTTQEIQEKLAFISILDSVEQVDILPYHRLGAGKYEMLGREYPLKDLEPPDPDFIEHLKSEILSTGRKVTVGG